MRPLEMTVNADGEIVLQGCYAYSIAQAWQMTRDQTMCTEWTQDLASFIHKYAALTFAPRLSFCETCATLAEGVYARQGHTLIPAGTDAKRWCQHCNGYETEKAFLLFISRRRTV